MSFDFSTLITDRTYADVSRVKELASKIRSGTASESELSEFNSAAMKGAYNHTDLNRVTAAMEALKAKLEGYGYFVPGYQRIKVPHVLPDPEPTSRLPEGYTELTYIQSTGTQYIDTGFKPNSNARIVADMEITSGTTSFLFGARHNSSANATSYSFSMVQISGASLRSDFGSVETTVSVSPVQRLAIDKNGNTTTVNGTTVTATAQSFSGSYNLALFTVNTAGTINSTKTSAKLYSCQIYDNDTLVRDYIPCINPDGDVGLYDLVTAAFFGNSGTGSFACNLDFTNQTWQQIIDACKSNSVPSIWKVGDQKTMAINGTDYVIDIIGKTHDTYADGSGTAPLTFQLHDCYETIYPMMSSATTSGGWTSCVMRTTYLPAILALMPSEVQAGIKEVSKLTAAGQDSSTINTTADKLFLLSEIEVQGNLIYSKTGEGSQYAWYAAGNDKKKYISGTVVSWWNRSPQGEKGFCILWNSGGGTASTATGSYGVSFAFCF